MLLFMTPARSRVDLVWRVWVMNSSSVVGCGSDDGGFWPGFEDMASVLIE